MFDDGLASVEVMSRPLTWRCCASPAALPAVAAVVLAHRRADQSLLSQSAPRSQDSSPLVLGLLELRFLASQKLEHLAQFPLGACPAQVPRTKASIIHILLIQY